MRRLRRTGELALAGLWLSLISGLAQADVVLVGTLAGRPGDEVEFSIEATPGTILKSIDIIPYYEDFAQVLTLVDFQPTTALTDYGSGLCLDGMCAFSFAFGKRFVHETVLATWHFKVTGNAEDFVDTQGGRTFPFDLNVLVEGQYVPLPDDQAFRVLAVPEPSSWSLTAAGILLLIASRYGRGPYSFRGMVRSLARARIACR